MSDDQRADELRQQMAQLRRRLDGDLDQVSESAQAMSDWRYYVRRFPWAAMAAATAAGFLLVPKHRTNVYPDSATLAELVKDNKVVVEHKQQASSMANSLIAMVGAAAMRMATAYVSEKVGAALKPSSTEENEAATPFSKPR